MLKKNPHMLLEILDHSKMEQISIATDIYLVHLQPYILKVKKSAESTFQFPKICGKSA